MDNFLIAKATSVGQVRQVNEDSMTVFDSPNGQVMAVCDGMGGQAAGDVASQLAVSIIENILTDNTFESPEDAICRSVLAANQGVLNRTMQNPELEGMGSTCVMLIIRNGRVHCGWVGDSRIYYIANHTIRQISHDQSVVQEMVDRGEITAEEAINHPQKNEVTNGIGVAGMNAPTTHAMPITPEPGSVFLLCSDGLSNMVSDAQIERVVSNTQLTLQQKADRLVQLANEAGGLDNITVELVQFADKNGSVGTMYDTPLDMATGKNIRKSKQKLYFAIAIAVLVIVSLAIGGYFMFGGEEPEPVKQEQPQNKRNAKHRGTTTQPTTNEKPKAEEPELKPKRKKVNTPSEKSKKAKEITTKGSEKTQEGNPESEKLRRLTTEGENAPTIEELRLLK